MPSTVTGTYIHYTHYFFSTSEKDSKEHGCLLDRPDGGLGSGDDF